MSRGCGESWSPACGGWSWGRVWPGGVRLWGTVGVSARGWWGWRVGRAVQALFEGSSLRGGVCGRSGVGWFRRVGWPPLIVCWGGGSGSFTLEGLDGVLCPDLVPLPVSSSPVFHNVLWKGCIFSAVSTATESNAASSAVLRCRSSPRRLGGFTLAFAPSTVRCGLTRYHRPSRPVRSLCGPRSPGLVSPVNATTPQNGVVWGAMWVCAGDAVRPASAEDA